MGIEKIGFAARVKLGAIWTPRRLCGALGWRSASKVLEDKRTAWIEKGRKIQQIRTTGQTLQEARLADDNRFLRNASVNSHDINRIVSALTNGDFLGRNIEIRLSGNPLISKSNPANLAVFISKIVDEIKKVIGEEEKITIATCGPKENPDADLARAYGGGLDYVESKVAEITFTYSSQLTYLHPTIINMGILSELGKFLDGVQVSRDVRMTDRMTEMTRIIETTITVRLWCD